MSAFPAGFLWGAATAPHQVEGNNTLSDFWANEGRFAGMDYSGDACDSYHRYPEDMRLLADAGFNTYRFGIEWARVEPRPGMFSRAELAHYRRMIDSALELGLTPMVTLHHFTNPRWFAELGGWQNDAAVDYFARYVAIAIGILDGVDWVCTINEPNMLAMPTWTHRLAADGAQSAQWQSPTVELNQDHEAPVERHRMPPPDAEIGGRFVAAHHRVRDEIRDRTGARVGWTVANRAFEVHPGGEQRARELGWLWEDLYLEAARGDDFIGVQSYSTVGVDEGGLVRHEPRPDDTLVGTPYRPDAVGIAVRHTWEVTRGVPIVITENGIATRDDSQRIAYTSGALNTLHDVINEGIPVHGYIHWSLFDNYEWGHWDPTFGLVEVDRETFVRMPKPSLRWLGDVARTNGASLTAPR